MMDAPWTIPLMAGLCMGAAVGALFLKQGAAALSRDVGALMRNWRLALGVALFGAATVVYVVLLRYEQLSVLYALGATTYVWTALLARVYLKERVGPLKVMGIVAIVAGIALVSVAS